MTMEGGDVGSLVFAAAILSLAAFVQAVSGFGLALVATAALPLVMPLKEAVAAVSVFNLFVCVVAMWHHWRAFSWRLAWPVSLAMCAGIPAGFYLHHALDPALLLRLLGGVLVAIAAADLRFSPRREYRLPGWSAIPLGLAGGVAGGAFNVGGPPVVAWVYSQNWENARNVAVLQAVFFASGVTRNVLMGFAGDYTRGLFVTLAWSALPAAVAIWLGKHALDRIPKRALRLGVFLFVLAMGLRYLLVSPSASGGP
ncbi:MAG: sulfite exporter TauE/SafE family protein [Akkermansiaceae bacterium]|nr:sulfite exporter TauE/SafE family protein [Akkermansiaceae bacterium]MCP5551607.1 sulfite exporter TauE/SafE family protein [Akkermansiaceae bacterium]